MATIPVGYGIQWMAVTRDGSKLFAESYDYAYESHIVSIDTATKTVSQVLGIAAFLGQMAVTPDRSKLYVNSPFSAQPGLLVIDAKTLTVSTMVPIYVGTSVCRNTGWPFSPTCKTSGPVPVSPNVAVMDTTRAVPAQRPSLPLSAATLASIPVGAMDNGNQLYLEYGGAAVSPDGTRAYVTSHRSAIARRS